MRAHIRFPFILESWTDENETTKRKILSLLLDECERAWLFDFDWQFVIVEIFESHHRPPFDQKSIFNNFLRITRNERC